MWEKYKHVIDHIAVGAGVINEVAGWACSKGYQTVLVVCDPNTRRVAGERVIAALSVAGLTVRECLFPWDEPRPDEQTIGFLTAAFDPDVELILGVGSGTINDTCTYIGARVGRPTAIVGTAPSMDGYASIGSAMLLDGVKVTPPTVCPSAIFCDTDIMTAAPMHMIAAGLGDMLGKITSLADWRLSHILTGEDMPDDIRDIVDNALKKIIAGALHITKREPAVIQSITEGLILSGIAISLYGDSRPASGTEHHLAHFWEMRMYAQGITPALHGLKVGLATITALAMWKELLTITAGEVAPPCPDEHERNIRRLYGRTAEAILQTKNPSLPFEHITAHWQEILDIAMTLPEPEEVAKMLTAAGAPVRPPEVSLDSETLRDSIIFSRDRKKTYSILQLLGGFGRLEDFADRIVRYFSNDTLTGVKCFVLDMDGTIYLGDKLFPYTLSFLEQLKETGKDYIFFTNNSSQNAEHYIKKLKRMGIPIPPEKLLMSTQVLLEFLRRRGDDSHETAANRGTTLNPGFQAASVVQNTRVFIAGTEALKADFIAAGYTLTEHDPEFTVLGFDTDMDYKRLTKLCDFIRSGVPVYGVNMDRNCPVDGGGFIPDCGALAAAVTTSTGISPEFFGKPSRSALDYIIQKTGYREDELCFVGDRLYTDIAIAAGTKARSVLVLSGETCMDDLSETEFVPDLVVDDLADLMKYL